MINECIFTPVKGSHSCRYCRFSLDPDLYDGACTIRPDLFKRYRDGDVAVMDEIKRMNDERLEKKFNALLY